LTGIAGVEHLGELRLEDWHAVVVVAAPAVGEVEGRPAGDDR
jgi:hypothetical protein